MSRWSKKIVGLCVTVAMCETLISGNGVTDVKAANGQDISTTSVSKTSSKIELSDEDLEKLQVEKDYTFTRDSIHDPSVVDGKNGYYYVFGSHMGVSKSSDFMNWVNVTNESTSSSLFGKVMQDGSVEAVSYNEAFRDNQAKKVTVLVDGTECEVDFGTYDASAWNTARGENVSGNMWAPDVIYNETMGKWCMYYSLNGTKWNSSIILLTADDIEGPYVYQGPVVYTGFSQSVEALSYKNTDIELVLGELDELPAKYNKADNGIWGDYWPHAIDPCVFFDEEGNLWMSYGSWSGGIYMLELDETTGLRDYTVTYESDYEAQGKNVTSDEYYGKKIAGGFYVSGEGSYIQRIGEYYYLFMSYGFYSPEEGYQMRVFRSKNPDGPYVDTTGTSAIFKKYAMNYKSSQRNVADTRGERLMANYQWNTMSVGEGSQGHNSALVDEDGRAYLIYHTKFNDGTVGHALRVHELFTNKNGWLVASPYEFTNNDALVYDQAYPESEVAGEYEILVHVYENGGTLVDGNAAMEVITPESIELNEDGTITGAYSGTWKLVEDTAYIDITLDGAVYSGVLVKQTVDMLGIETMCFTAVDEASGVTIWGSKNLGDQQIIALNVNEATVDIPDRTYTDITLPTQGVQGAEITWSSSKEDVLTSAGEKKEVTEPENVTLTQTISKGNYEYKRTFKVTVLPEQSDGKELIASYFTKETEDASKGLQQTISIRNPYADSVTKGIDVSGGITVAMDVEPFGDLHALGALIAFGDSGKLYFTPASYLGYNAGSGYFDANMKDYACAEDYIGEIYAQTKEPVHVEIVINSKGFYVSMNGNKVYDTSILETENGSGTVKNYKSVINWLHSSAEKVYIGSGSWWNAEGYDEANAYISNLEFYVNGTSTEEKEVATQPFGREKVQFTVSDAYEEMENPFYGKTVEQLQVSYTINFATDAAKNGWDGIFSFYNTSTGGRVSFQTAPYICYNEGTGKWIDINGAGSTTNLSGTFEKEKDYKITLQVTKEESHLYVDGVEQKITVNGSGATNADLLSYISECDVFTWGVGQAVSSYWWTELCTLTDIEISPVIQEKEETEETKEIEETKETEEVKETKETVMIYVYNQKNMTKPVVTKAFEVVTGSKFQLSLFQIEEYYQSENGFTWEGFYRQGAWEQYKKGNKLPVLEADPVINGYTNLFIVVTDIEKDKNNRILHTVTYVDGVDNVCIFKDQVYYFREGEKFPQFQGTPYREGYRFDGFKDPVKDKNGNYKIEAKFSKYKPVVVYVRERKTGGVFNVYLTSKLKLVSGDMIEAKAVKDALNQTLQEKGIIDAETPVKVYTYGQWHDIRERGYDTSYTMEWQYDFGVGDYNLFYSIL